MQRGGAEMRLLDVMREIDNDVIKMDFCALSGQGGELDTEVESLGGTVHHIGLSAAFPIRFMRLLRRNRYDVVHSHVHLFSGYVLTLARMAGVPRLIIHFRNTDDGGTPSLRRRLYRALGKRLALWSADHVFGVCRAALERGWGSGWEDDPRCLTVYNGIDLTRRQNGSPGRIPDECRSEAGGPLIVHVGRFDPQKNHERLLEIFATIVRERQDARLLLIGRGDTDEDRRAKERASRLDLEGRVAFLGIRGDVSDLLAASDLLLFPSRWEGLPGVVLESLAAGTPVLASDLPGVVEIASRTHGITTRSLDDSDSSWAQAALDILSTENDVRIDRGGPFDIRTCASTLVEYWVRGNCQA